MQRLGKDEYYIGIAENIYQRSTCLRRKYGAVIVKNDEIVATGYNGAPRGVASCLEKGYCWREKHEIPHGSNYESCYHEDTVIKLLDGTYKTIKELAEAKKDVWVYSYDADSGKIVPALATNARMTGYRSDLIKITFDNNAYIICTSDEKLLLRKGKYKETKNIKYGDSFMPIYYRIEDNGATSYEHICNTIRTRREGKAVTWKKEYAGRTNSTPTHRLVYEHINKKVPNNLVVHHKNGNSLDNRPINLELVLKEEHIKHHIRENPRSKAFLKRITEKGRETQKKMLLENEEFKKLKRRIGSQNMSNNWKSKEFVDKMKRTQYERSNKGALISNKDPEAIKNRDIGKVISGISYLLFKAKESINSDNYEVMREKYKRKRNEKGSVPPKTQRILKYFNSIEDAIQKASVYNHKVVNIEKLNMTYPVYDISVYKYHNFAIDLGDNSCIFGHNCFTVHAEQNAIISASRKEMIGSTMYIAGENIDKTLCNSFPCNICLRMILNAGIEICKYRTKSGEIRIEYPQIIWKREEYLVVYKG